jgi:hypothetical protein
VGKANQSAEELRKKLAEIDRISKQLGDNSSNFSSELRNVEKHADTINKLFSSLSSEVNSLNKDFQSLNSELGDIVKETNKFQSSTSKNTRALKSTVDIAREYQNLQKGNTQLSSKEIKELQKKLSKNKENLNDLANEIKQRRGLGKSVETEGVNRLLSLGKINAEEANILKAQRSGFSDIKSINNGLDERFKKEKKYEGAIKSTKGLLNTVADIPILGKALETEKAMEAAEKAAREGASAGKTMGVAFKSMGKSLISGPFLTIGLIVKGFKELLNIGFQVDSQIVDISKSQAVSAEVATIQRDRMVEIQNSTEDVFMTTKNQVAAQLELADAMGATRGFTEKQVEDQITLTKKMGLSADVSGKIQKLGMMNKMNATDVTKIIVKQSSLLAKQTGIQLDNKKVIEEVAKVEGQLAAQYKNNPDLIAAAVVQAKKLGIEIKTAKNMAEGMLDFEKSLEAELSAEILTGKELNLERARGLALQGKSVEAAGAMLKEVGSLNDFMNMNPIQQKALADAMHMTTDELSNSLIQQENLRNLGGQLRDQVKERAEALRAEGRVAEANQLMNSIGNAKEAEEALAKVKKQEEFNQAIEKMKSVLVSIVEGPAMKMAQWIGDLLKHTTVLKGVFAAIAAIITTKMVVGLAQAIGKSLVLLGIKQATAVAEMTAASALTLGIGIAAVIGGIVAGVAMMNSMMDDGIIGPAAGGKSGYGKRVLFGPEGAISFNDKDTIVAGTNLFGDDVVSEPGKSAKTTPKGTNKQNINVKVEMGPTNDLIKKTNENTGKALIALNELYKVTSDTSLFGMGSLVMDGNKVGEMIGLENREIQ